MTDSLTDFFTGVVILQLLFLCTKKALAGFSSYKGSGYNILILPLYHKVSGVQVAFYGFLWLLLYKNAKMYMISHFVLTEICGGYTINPKQVSSSFLISNNENWGFSIMKTNKKDYITMTDANRSFAKVAKLADANGRVTIYRHNRPKYALVDLDKVSNDEFVITEEEKLDIVAGMVLKKYAPAFRELAKG